VVAAEIGDISFPPRAIEYYTAGLIGAVDTSAVKGARPKVVLDYSYGTASFVMPNVLSKLGAEVLAVNPYGSTKLALASDPRAQAALVADLVRAAGATLGGLIDADGERLVLVDDTGHVLTATEATLAFVSLVAQANEGARIALPVNATLHAERIAADLGAEVVWCGLATPSLMAAACQEGVLFAADAQGGFIIPSFLPAFDAAAALSHLLGLLAANGTKLSKVVASLPRAHVVREEVITPWDAKGMVMRTLVEQTKDREQVLVDGVKVLHDDGWALVLPDPEEQVTHVWAEGPSEAEARAIAQEYARRIRTLVR
jgi:mannose-1-phosphate guanylyltransferase/phosphomannomutase